MGVSAFGINAYTGANAGDEVIEPHDEQGDGSGHHEELYVVADRPRGVRARRRERSTRPPGTLVFVAPGAAPRRDGAAPRTRRCS